MSKPSFYDKLTDAEKKEYDEKISAMKKEKESYVSKNMKTWNEFFSGKAGLRQFARDSKSAKSKYQYFFTRDKNECFQYKSFVADLLEAIALKEGLSSQRKSMMKYELVRFLQPQRTSRAGERSGAGVEVNKEIEELNAIGRAKEAEKKAKQVANNINKSAIVKELNAIPKAKEEPIITKRPSFEQMTPQRTADGKKVICPFDAGDPKSDKWLEQHPHIDAELVVFKDEV